MIVQISVPDGESMHSVRDRILADVFGEDGYNRPGSDACAGPVLLDSFTSIPAFAIALSEQEAERLRAHPDVRSVSTDELHAPTRNGGTDNNPDNGVK
ncbi:MAG: protease inhibitor I9 family protein [Pseudomonadota bacterium]|nr:protease inhibitor I9 family protein [Pseudomonadota bacterium]